MGEVFTLLVAVLFGALATALWIDGRARARAIEALRAYFRAIIKTGGGES